MAHCNDYIDLISASLDGALTPEEAARLEAHLAACPECRKAKMELEAVHAALQNLPTAEPPAGLYDRIMEAVAADNVVPFAPPAKKKPAFRWQKWAAAAAMFAVMMVGYGSVKGPDKAAELLPVSPEPTAETAIGSDSLPQGRSMDAQNEADAIQAFSEDGDSTTDAVAPMTVSQPPVSGDTAPQPTPAPPFKSAGQDEEASPQPTAMVRAFMTTALPAEETPGEGEEEAIDTLDIAPFALPIPEGTGDEEENSAEIPLLTSNGLSQGSEVDETEEDPEAVEAVMTPRDALDVLLADRELLENTSALTPEIISTWQIPTEEEFIPGWCSPEWLGGDPDEPYCSQHLCYSGLNEEETVYWFAISQIAISAEAQEAQSFGDFIESPVQFGVPIDGSEPFAVGS